MSNVNLSDFKSLYLSTAKEYLQKMQDKLVTLEKNPKDREAIETLHMSSHSLKSQSLLMGYSTTGELSYQIELIFRKLVDQSGSLSENLVEPLTEAVADLKNSILQIETTGNEKNLSSMKNTLASLGGSTQ